MHSSLIDKPKASKAATVVSGAEAAEAKQPSALVVAKVPVMVGAIVS